MRTQLVDSWSRGYVPGVLTNSFLFYFWIELTSLKRIGTLSLDFTQEKYTFNLMSSQIFYCILVRSKEAGQLWKKSGKNGDHALSLKVRTFCNVKELWLVSWRLLGWAKLETADNDKSFSINFGVFGYTWTLQVSELRVSLRRHRGRKILIPHFAGCCVLPTLAQPNNQRLALYTSLTLQNVRMIVLRLRRC